MAIPADPDADAALDSASGEGGGAARPATVLVSLRRSMAGRLQRVIRLRNRTELVWRARFGRLPGPVRAAAGVMVATWREFQARDCPTHAAALAFHMLFGLFPLLLAAGVIVSYVSADRDAYATVLETLAQFLPEGDRFIESNLMEAVKLRGAFGLVAIAGLVWSGTRVFEALRTGLNAAWNVTAGSEFAQGVARDLAAFLVLAPLCFLSVGLSALIETVRYMAVELGQSVPAVGFLGSVFALRLAPLATSVLAFECAYVWLPSARVTWKQAAPGALLAGTLFEVAKAGFALYAANAPSFSLVYGSLGTVIALLLWIHLSVIILLLGAVFTTQLSLRPSAAAH